MEINEQVINDLTELVMSTFENTKLTSKGLVDAQMHTQALFQRVKELVTEIAMENPDFTQEQIVEAASNRVEEIEMEQEKQNEEQEQDDPEL